jgi:hypothetical protein
MNVKTYNCISGMFIVTSFFAGREFSKRTIKSYEYGLIIWNDDPESIPMNNEFVRLEIK